MNEFDRLPCEYGKEDVLRILRKGIDLDSFDFDSVSVQMIELMGALGFSIEVDGDDKVVYFTYYGRI